jgi:hypothetical protein
MNRIKRYIATALAFALGETLVCVMLLTALACKLAGSIRKSQPPR